jgi:hypothetical protein
LCHLSPLYTKLTGTICRITKRKESKYISVLDKKEKSHTFPVTRHMGVKITQNNGKKTTFYFDTLLLQGSTITGSKTHFLTARIKPIPFANINKIELQR